MMKIFGQLRWNRVLNKSRLRLLLCISIVCSLAYHILPKLLNKVPPSYNGWHDPDFHHQIVAKRGNERNLSGRLPKKENIIILHWTGLWRQYLPEIQLNSETCSDLEAGTFQQPGTKVFDVPCRTSYDRRYLDVSDALVFHSFDLMWDDLPNPHKRNSKQFWVYLQQESPIYTKLNLQAYPNTFNWTMTYRRDSDVYHPYGHLIPRSNPPNTNNFSSPINGGAVTTLLRNKTRLVAWIVSSCDSHSKREYFVQELQKYLTIDIFGWCGIDCPSTSGDCYSHVQSTHKFYLSFENSLCTDYITEKFFNALKSGMVPVVYGGSQAQDYLAIAPKDSFIDARSFNSPKDLANYLFYLDKNDKEYMKYFEWKNKYQLATSHVGWCNLCQRIYEQSQRVPPPERKWFQDLWKWWNYMSYDTSVEVDEQQAAPSQMAMISQSYYYKLGSPACLSPHKKFIQGSKTKPDFEPGFLNAKIFGKLWSWAKETLYS